MLKNHTNVQYPNHNPTFSVPLCCTENNTTRINADINTIYGLNQSVMYSNPSTADKIDIAGVISPSPNNSPAERVSIIPVSMPTPRNLAPCRRPKRANVPPSP